MWYINDALQIWISSVVSSEQMYSKGIQSSSIKKNFLWQSLLRCFFGHFWAAHLESVSWAAHFSAPETGLCHLLWWLRLPVESRPPQRQQLSEISYWISGRHLSWSHISDLWYWTSLRYIQFIVNIRWVPTSAEAATILISDLRYTLVVFDLNQIHPGSEKKDMRGQNVNISDTSKFPTSAEAATFLISDLSWSLKLNLNQMHTSNWLDWICTPDELSIGLRRGSYYPDLWYWISIRYIQEVNKRYEIN